MGAPRSEYRTSVAAAAALLLGACATPPPGASRGALGVIDNVLSHEAAAPHAPASVRALLDDPLRSTQVEPVVTRELPAGLSTLAPPPAAAGPSAVLLEAILPYLDALAEAQRLLRAGVPGLADVPADLPPPRAQREIATRVDRVQIDRAAAILLEATAKLLGRRIDFPAQAVRYERGDIEVIVGSPDDDLHRLSPVRAGAVRVILEPGGNDRFTGPGVAAGGIAVVLDLGGNDRYESAGPSWGAAIGGIALHLDAAGNDTYASGSFAQGAALAGVGILLDLGGDDTYLIEAFGQGLGLAGGTGVLWDLAGNDRYFAQGMPDPFGRGGGLSYAQGVAVGVRTGMGGGVGVLRDDAGDDAYTAQMYAQGAAYYYGLGTLWDRGGDDRYAATRYAQGAGVHQAVGVLRDESGDDAYVLSAGVGQGIGVDLAVGALVDAGGGDHYRAPTLAQGAATANGVGIVSDEAGINAWRLDRPPGHGQTEWSRGLPSPGIVIGDAPRFDGPVTHESEDPLPCPSERSAPLSGGESIADALRSLGPGLVRDRVSHAGYALLMQELRARPEASLASLPEDDFDALWPLATALRCALEGADDARAASMWNAFERILAADAGSRFAGAIAVALRARPAPRAQQHRLIAQLAAHPSCGVRTAALRLDGSVAAAQAALRSSCWQLQSRALRILGAQGVAPQNLAGVPEFLRSSMPPAAPRAP